MKFNTKYQRPGPLSFREEDFFPYSLLSPWKTSDPVVGYF